MPRSKKQKPSQKPDAKRDAQGPGLVTFERVAELTVIPGENERQEKTVIASVSSETPCLAMRTYRGGIQSVYEILSHAPEDIDRTYIADGLIIRDTHGGDQIGLIHQPTVQDGKLGGPIEFCAGARAQEIQLDALAGLRRNISLEAIVDTRTYTAEGDRDGIPVVRAVRWTPTGAVFTSHPPADPTIGVAREAESPEAANPPADDTTTEPKTKNIRRNIMTPEETEAAEKAAQDEQAKRAAESNARAAEVVRILELASHLSIEPEVVREAVGKGQALADCQDKWLKVVAERTKTNAGKPRQDNDIELDEKEKKQYSLFRAIRAILPDTPATQRDCFEKDVSDEIAKTTNKTAQGILVPWDTVVAKRDVTVASTGSNVVATDLLAGSFIDVLASVMVAGRLGVQIMDGLSGDIAIPKQTAGQTVYWVSEGNDITESDPTLAQVTGTPHCAGVMVDVTRKLLKQSAISVEQWLSRELMRCLGVGVDKAIFQGSGAAGQPTGLVNVSGVNTPTVSAAGSPTWTETLTFLSMIMLDNAWFGGMKWAIRPNVFAKLACTTKDTGSGQFVLDTGSKTIAGYPYEITNQTQSNSAWFGDWSQVILGLWSAIDLTVDPYKHSASGGLRLVALQDCDVLARHGQAFSYSATMAS